MNLWRHENVQKSNYKIKQEIIGQLLKAIAAKLGKNYQKWQGQVYLSLHQTLDIFLCFIPYRNRPEQSFVSNIPPTPHKNVSLNTVTIITHSANTLKLGLSVSITALAFFATAFWKVLFCVEKFSLLLIVLRNGWQCWLHKWLQNVFDWRQVVSKPIMGHECIYDKLTPEFWHICHYELQCKIFSVK